MKTIMQKIKKTLITYDIELVEVMSGVAGIAWGAWLLIPMLNTFDLIQSYMAMNMIASEEVWGVAMVWLGFYQVYAVVSHRLAARKRSSLAASLVWLFITSMIAISNLASTGVAVYAVFTFFTMWSYLRLSQRVEITSKFSHK